MKRLTLLLAFLAVNYLNAQTRVSLLEEFTGENCPPCAAYNPALDALLAQPANVSKIIAIKWQVPIPSSPFSSNSLYITNKAEIDWRYQGVSSGGYGYQAMYTPTHTPFDGILNAPTCFIDGKNQWAFGATSDHPYYLRNAVINTAAAVPTPFSLNMATAWNGNFSNCVVTVTVVSSAAFTSVGNLKFRLCLVERYIEFPNPPGTNGETIFRDAVRQSYPTTIAGSAVTGMGTSLPSSWTAGQQQVLTISCAIPNYVTDLSQMAFVGFVQDDGDKQVYQTARTSQPSIPNDAQAGTIHIPQVMCSSSMQPSITVKNNGPVAITALTITPELDGVAGTNVNWTGNLAPGGSVLVPMNSMNATAGTHTYQCTIVGVSGGDIIAQNNTSKWAFVNASSYSSVPPVQGFESPVFPPPNWYLNNPVDPTSFRLSSLTGGFSQSPRSMEYPLYISMPGQNDEIFMEPTDISTLTNPEISFDLAYQQNPGSKDSLYVFVSSDCGSSWTMIYGNGGSSMATAPLPNNSNFTPMGTEWITITSPLANTSSQVIIKFRMKTDGGNGLFLDNINLKSGNGVPTGINTLGQNAWKVNVYPNPVSSIAYLSLNAEDSGFLLLELENSLGQLVYSKKEKLSVGDNTASIDCKDLPEGIYLLKMESGEKMAVKKLMISK